MKIKNINKNNIFYFICGLLSSLAMPPVFLTPFILLLYIPLVYIYEQQLSLKEYFIKSWLLFCGHFAASWYWICISLTLDLATYFWLIPFALLGLPAALSLIPATTLIYNSKFPKVNIYIRSLAFAATLTIAELIRSYIFTGFPWTLVGYIWSNILEISQICAVIGIYGLSFVTIFISCLISYSVIKKSYNGLVIGVAIVVGIYIFGYIRLNNHPTEFSDKTVHVIQANIPQNLKWDKDERINGFAKHVKLTREAGKADLAVWPESAIPFMMHALIPSGNINSYIEDLVKSDGYLISGVVRTETNYPDKFWNSMFVFDNSGNVVDYYDKIHLLPFGEYIPLSKYIPMQKITHGQGEFSFGQDNRREVKLNYSNDKVTVLPLICYEAVYTKLHEYNSKYDVIVNITNDAWFGNSSGPYQHFYMSRIRAIEYGLPLVRAANTGVSGIFDAYGRILEKSNFDKAIVLTSKIPLKAQNVFYRDNFNGKNLVMVFVYILFIVSLFIRVGK